MTDTKIEAAMTAEEWRRLRYPPPLCVSIEQAHPSDLASMADDSRHALAALALYGQPFGFTAEEVRFLREEVDVIGWDRTVSAEGDKFVEDDRGRLYSIAARIAALLPE